MHSIEFAQTNVLLSESPIKSTDLDYSLYTTKTLTPDYKIHWRILKEQKEIEMVLVVNGTSWVGFGWRPKKLTAECRKFPLLHDIGAEAETVAEPEPSSSSEPEPISEKSSKSEPEPISEKSSKSEPEPSSEKSPISEPESEPSSSKSHEEPLALGSSKSKRVAAPQTLKTPNSKDEYTVSTSVSYRVSTVTGRRKRDAQKGKNFINCSRFQTKNAGNGKARIFFSYLHVLESNEERSKNFYVKRTFWNLRNLFNEIFYILSRKLSISKNNFDLN